MQQPIAPPNPQSTSQQLPTPGKSTDRKTIFIGSVIAVIVVVMLLVLVFAGMIGGDLKAAPQGTMNAMVSAYNNYDAKGFINCTTLKFLSSSNYSITLSSMMTTLNMKKNDSVHISITNVAVKYSAQMTVSERSNVDSAIGYLAYQGINADVDDSCIVSFVMTVTGEGYGGYLPGTNLDILLKINGLWYSSNLSVWV